MAKFYTDEKNALILISLLKAHGIRKVVASPGATNVSFVGSIQNDNFFQVYSSVDERSAAYIACGLAYESQEPVIISCTGATASRNYLPGLTEAYYRKLPILAITSSQIVSRVGHNVPQVIDRSQIPRDVAKFSTTLPVVKDKDDEWDCMIKVNSALLELTRSGGGPVHINLPTVFSQKFETERLPISRVINRYTYKHKFPDLNERVAIFVGSHKPFSESETAIIDEFCAIYDAVVFCDHTSGYSGKYKVLYSLVGSQDMLSSANDKPDILIHLGEISGDYSSISIVGPEIWRVSEDGEIRDPYRRLKNVFEVDESYFFSQYTQGMETQKRTDYLDSLRFKLNSIKSKIPELPFSNIWVASKLSQVLPANSVIHFGILNSLRSWNFFELPDSVESTANVGGFGIDGGLSSLVGASLHDSSKLYFIAIGDLAFFYDMNVLGNRHVPSNIRILLINNGKGTEFRQYNHSAISAAGHFGKQSRSLVKNYVEDLGFKYMSANNKDEFYDVYTIFVNRDEQCRPIVFEVFTDSDDESNALELIRSIKNESGKVARNMAKRLVGEVGVKSIRRILKKT